MKVRVNSNKRLLRIGNQYLVMSVLGFDRCRRLSGHRSAYPSGFCFYL